jgi:hypothetical protein
VSYDQLKRVIKVDGFDPSKSWDGRNIDVSISSQKIKIMLPGNYSQHHVVYTPNRKCFRLLPYLGIESLCVLSRIVSDDRSKRVMKVGALDRRWAFCDEPKF